MCVDVHGGLSIAPFLEAPERHRYGQEALDNEGTAHAIGVEMNTAMNGLFDGSSPGKHASGITALIY